jgi:hypothetical protein
VGATLGWTRWLGARLSEVNLSGSLLQGAAFDYVSGEDTLVRNANFEFVFLPSRTKDSECGGVYLDIITESKIYIPHSYGGRHFPGRLLVDVNEESMGTLASEAKRGISDTYTLNVVSSKISSLEDDVLISEVPKDPSQWQPVHCPFGKRQIGEREHEIKRAVMLIRFACTEATLPEIERVITRRRFATKDMTFVPHIFRNYERFNCPGAAMLNESLVGEVEKQLQPYAKARGR